MPLHVVARDHVRAQVREQLQADGEEEESLPPQVAHEHHQRRSEPHP